ncbi:MAG: glutamate 5-kinase, partial [Gammaproteobacteria bacterium]|nr:glutamate 5-kinase [Gammaproteobacteria bacterium]
HTLIADGRRPGVLGDAFAGRSVGTLLAADVGPLVARKRWIAGQQRPKGELVLDAGAAKALRERGVSLLPVGVAAVRGEFNRGALVRCVNAAGDLIAQGLVNYSSAETLKICGAASSDIRSRLGYCLEPELMHRDNLVLI